MAPRFAELRAALADPERAVAAARALGRARDPEAVPILLAHFDLAGPWRGLRGWIRGAPIEAAEVVRARRLRQAIVAALAEIGAPALAPALRRGLPRGDLVQIARRCAEAALPVLVGELQGRERRRVCLAVQVLRELGDPRAIAGLAPLLDHPAWSVSGRVWRTLVRLGRRDPDALAAAVAERPAWSRLSIRALAGDPRVVPALVTVCAAGEGWRARALRSLAAVRAREGLPWLLRGLADPDDAVVTAAIESLGELGEAAAIGPLLATLSRPRHAFAASEALGRLLRSPRPLLAAVDEGLAPGLAALVLRAIRPIEDVEALVEVLRRPSPDLREAAAAVAHQVPGKVRRAALQEPLAAALAGDPEARVRRAAAYALGRLHVVSAIGALRGAQADVDASVRAAATRGLEFLGVREA